MPVCRRSVDIYDRSGNSSLISHKNDFKISIFYRLKRECIRKTYILLQTMEYSWCQLKRLNFFCKRFCCFFFEFCYKKNSSNLECNILPEHIPYTWIRILCLKMISLHPLPILIHSLFFNLKKFLFIPLCQIDADTFFTLSKGSRSNPDKRRMYRGDNFIIFSHYQSTTFAESQNKS